MEDGLGVSLFERHRGGARLTHAGRRFLDDCRVVFSHLDSAVRAVTAAGYAGEGALNLGLVASISAGFCSRLIRAWRDDHPGVRLEISEGAPREHIAAILDRRIDLTFINGVNPIDGCDVERLWDEQILAAVPTSHAFAQSVAIRLDELSQERFIVSKAAPGPEIHDYLLNKLSNLVARPLVSHYGVGREMLMSMVGLGFGISLVSSAEVGVRYPGVAFIPLVGETLPVSAVWSPENDNPALRRFLSAARVMSRIDA